MLRSRLSLLVLMLAAVLAMPAAASAADYLVNTTEDSTPEVGCPEVDECNLRSAITKANSDGEPSTIEFAVSGELELTAELPTIVARVTIDATSVLGLPTVELDGSALPPEADGITLEEGSASESRVEGLAIGGFDRGFEIWGDDNVLCANYVGTDLSGTVANPNAVGIEMVEAASVFAEENEIGAGCLAGNVISGNEGLGVADAGLGTELEGNLIGVGADGGALGNGGGGIRSAEQAAFAIVRGNTIAHNGGPGFLVEDGTGGPIILRNSFFDNAGLGIEIVANAEVEPPLLSGVTEVGGAPVVSGTITGDGSNFELEFYANAACDPSGSGEGQTFIGKQFVDGAPGATPFAAAELGPLPAGQRVVTATATVKTEGPVASSEFSACLIVPAPPGPPAPPVQPAPAPIVAIEPTPVNGESVAVAPEQGTIKVKAPGSNKFKILKEGQTIPVGSLVDATKGKVTLTSVNAAGETQTAVFYGGLFLVAQHEGSGLVLLKLRGGNFKSCKKGAARTSVATASGRSGRRLWGSGKGKFRTEGSYGSATVRGTVWLTEDRCDGTFFKVKKGIVSIRDFVSQTSLSLPAGKTYLASKTGE